MRDFWYRSPLLRSAALLALVLLIVGAIGTGLLLLLGP